MNTKQNDASQKHNLKKLVSFYFEAKKTNARIETLDKWIGAIKSGVINKEVTDLNTQKWAEKIDSGEWVTNKFGRKLFYKLGGGF